jgi:hypothetical protein
MTEHGLLIRILLIYRHLLAGQASGKPVPACHVHARGPELHGARGLRPLPQWAPAVSVGVDGAVLIFR